MVVLEQLRLALRSDPSSLRPHERESMLTRDNGSEIRALVMLSFPAVIALMWPHVTDGTHAWFIGSFVGILVLNVLGWAIPWRRLPRWMESIPPLGSIPLLWLMTATTGGFDGGCGMLLVVPTIWIAMYADTLDVLLGHALAAALVLPPMHAWIDPLPHQGDLSHRASLVLLLLTCSFGVRPIVNALREQLRTSRRASFSLRASQAALAHDLRTPLTSMCALAELAEQRLGDDEVDAALVQDYVGRIAQLGWRAETIIRGVLDLSHAAELLPAVADVDIASLVREVAAGVEGVNVDIREMPTTVVGNEPSLRQLFANLLDNAARHGVGTEPGDVARVEVSGTDHVGGWRFQVRDHGPGIASDEADVVFQAWRRGAGARDGGHGLGLAIVAAIGEQHGGTIEVHDADPHGACFDFTLSRSPRLAHHQDELVARSATGVPLGRS